LLQNYTQYIPLSIYDLQTWMGSPSIYVYDCSNAGLIIKSFHQFAEQHQKEYEVTAMGDIKIIQFVNSVLALSFFLNYNFLKYCSHFDLRWF